jgi:hypothetical protein
MTQHNEAVRSTFQYTNLSSRYRDGSRTPSDIELEDRSVGNSQTDFAEGSSAPSTRAAFRNIQNRPPIPGHTATTDSSPVRRRPVPLINVSSDQITQASQQTGPGQDGDISDANARSSASMEEAGHDAERRRLLSTPDNIRVLNDQHLSIDGSYCTSIICPS